MVELSGETAAFDIDELLRAFDHRCFRCGVEVGHAPARTPYVLDHTLPAFFLWPLNLGPTILCGACNGEKAQKWPSQFYTTNQLRTLAVKTGIPYDLLAGAEHLNPEAIDRLCVEIDDFLVRWIAYPDRIRALRERILGASGIDILAGAANVPPYLLAP